MDSPPAARPPHKRGVEFRKWNAVVTGASAPDVSSAANGGASGEELRSGFAFLSLGAVGNVVVTSAACVLAIKLCLG